MNSEKKTYRREVTEDNSQREVIEDNSEKRTHKRELIEGNS